MSRSTSSSTAATSEQVPAWSRRELLVLLSITAFGAVLRMWRLELWSLSPLEAENWAAAAGVAGEDWTPARSLASRLLQFLLTTGLMPSHGEGWLRLPFVFVGIVTVPLVALVGSRFLARSAALLAAALLAVHPAHVLWSQTVSGAVFAVALAVLAIAAWTGLAERLRWLGLALLVAAFLCAPWRGDSGAVFGALRPALVAIAAAGAWSWRRSEGGAVDARLAHERRLLVALAFVPPLVVAALALLLAVPDAAVAPALPVLVFLGGLGLHVWTRRLHAAVLRWQPEALPWAAAVPAGMLAALAFSDAMIGTWLGATVHRGHRAPAREAAAFVLHEAGGEPVEVRAGAALPSLAYYLQAGSASDHGPVRLRSRRAAGSEAPLQFEVLTAGEVAAWSVPDPTLLLVRAFAQPPGHYDRSLLVWRRRSP